MLLYYYLYHPSCVDVCKFMMYADDTVIFFSAPLISEIELQLNLELINLSEWLSTNKLILNLKKTEFMVFGTHQRLCRQDIDGAHITLGGESVKHCDAFKYLGVVLDNSLSFNLHTDYVKKTVSKTLRMFSRIRSSLTTEASHRLYKLMILPNLEYCCGVFHGCGKENEEELEHLQSRVAKNKIVLKTVHLSTQDMAFGLGWDPLKTRREKHIVELVKNCLDGQAPRYFSDYFQGRTYDIHDYDIRSKVRLSIDKVNLELTKRAYF